MQELFTTIKDVTVVDWHAAYPHYFSSESNLPPFQLHQGMFYTNAIEMSASAMEMSAIAARNVALLIYHQWNGSSNFIDLNLDTHSKHIKDEF